MTLIEVVMTVLMFLLKGITLMVLLGFVLLVLIAAEIALCLRKSNKKKMEENENESDSI